MLESYSEPEIQRWLYVRAVEWTAWPAFITQPVVPILTIFFPLYKVLLAVFLLGIIWCAVRYSFVSPRLAQIAASFVLLKWPASLGSAIYLYAHRNYLSGTIALFWPLLAGLIGIPGKIGVVELALAKKIGYVDANATI